MAQKERKTLAEIRKVRSEAGKRGAVARGFTLRGQNKPSTFAKLAKEAQKDILDQRFLRVTDNLANAQISLATGLQFLYKIEKRAIKNTKGEITHYENEKPELVMSQLEIENYLAELAENNGDISDNGDASATYYYLTTKEPQNNAVEAILNRVHGKARETVNMNVEGTFSLAVLAGSRVIDVPKITEAEVKEELLDMPE